MSIENQIVLEKSRKDLLPSIYTTFNSAVVRINYAKMLAESKSASSTIDSLIKSPFKLKISKVFLKYMITANIKLIYFA